MRLVLAFVFACLSFGVSAQDTIQLTLDSAIVVPVYSTNEFKITHKSYTVNSISSEISVKYTGDETILPTFIWVNNETIPLVWNDLQAKLNYTFTEEQTPITIGQTEEILNVNIIPLWWSIVPPLMAILLALLFKEVVTSLFIGILVGAAILGVYAGGIDGIWTGLLAVIDTYVINSLNNWGHLAVIIFSMLIGALVSVISKNGGMKGVVDRVSVYANSPRSGQFATWLLGILIFFDDYANTLVVGNTMRPVTDKLKISREKLSYLVDSTAAPIAAIAFVTTWIGAELGYIESGVAQINEAGSQIEMGAYAIFLSSLQYSFYPILALLFMLILIWKGKDFGPMHKAEMNARKGEDVYHHGPEKLAELAEFEVKEGAKTRSYNAVIPIGVVIIGTLLGLLVTGWNTEVWNDETLSFSRKLSAIIGASDSYTALLWSSMVALIVAIGLSVGQRILTLEESMHSVMSGFKTMMNAVIILVLAWSLASITEDLHTATFLTQLFGGNIAPWLMPAITFLLAALVAFSTGSSWGTMAILYPLMLPAAWSVCMASGYDTEMALNIFFNVTSCVLAGSVLGDHCSPISDTTILSSLASSCKHIDHVRTQMPYALTVGIVAVVFGTIPTALGLSSWIAFPMCLLVLYAVVQFVGKKVPN